MVWVAPSPVVKIKFAPIRVVVGSLAACPSCGGLVVLSTLVLGVVSARHLTGDIVPRSCPRCGVGWASRCYEP